MRTAVIFTGQERNLHRTIRLLRNNLLGLNSSVVFLACESNDPNQMIQYFNGIEIGGSKILPSFRTPEFNAFMQMLSVSQRPALTSEVFNRTNEGWSMQYLEHSGTIIQYYQLWQGWLLLLDYEKKHNIQFDVVVRCRPDCLLTERIDLSRLEVTSDEFVSRSMGSDRLLRTIRTRIPHEVYEHPVGHTYTDKVVWTLGLEQVWIAKRDVFALLGPMMFTYGSWDSGRNWAFNSESFFQQFCDANHITHWGYMDHNQGSLFNFSHPGNDEVLDDQYVFSLLR